MPKGNTGMKPYKGFRIVVAEDVCLDVLGTPVVPQYLPARRSRRELAFGRGETQPACARRRSLVA